MRKEIILPGAVLASGVAGFFVRRWDLATGFEPDTGLAIVGADSNATLFLLSLALVLTLLWHCRATYNPISGYDQAFSAKGNTLYMLVMTGAAGLSLLAGVLGLLELPTAWAEAGALAARHGAAPSALAMAPRALLAFLCLGSAYGLFQVGRNNYQARNQGKYSVALLLPAYTACLWLIVSYQARSGDPVISAYAWQLFAIICAVLASYFMAGFAFERAKVVPAAFFSLSGIFFLCTTMADGHSPSMLLLYGSYLLYLLASVLVLLFNAERVIGRHDGRLTEGETQEMEQRLEEARRSDEK